MSIARKLFEETFGCGVFNKKKITKDGGTVDFKIYEQFFVCELDKISTVEAKTHKSKQ